MTSSAYATPMPTTPSGTILSGLNANPAVVSNITRVTSQPQSQFAVVTVGTEAPLAQSGAAALTNSYAQNVAKQAAAFQTRRLFAPGQFPAGATNYTNRPSITVIKNTLNTSGQAVQTPIGSYVDWYLNSVQEQDMERTDIIETFGSPHLFTSGRFTRKVVFSGMVRTTAMNNASTTVNDRVPQHVLLRNFYENFLRSTAQAKYDYFTRIVVDGDTYEGWVTSLQLPRDAALEMVMQFALTMIVVRRYNIHDNDAINTLSVFQTAAVQQLVPSFATAELKDAQPFRMSLSQTAINVGKVPRSGVLATMQSISLTTSSGGQVISVSGSAVGIWSLVYSDGTPVSGAQSRGDTVPVSLVLVNYPDLAISGPEEDINDAVQQQALVLQLSGADGSTYLGITSTTD